ncbi:hypothetical protein B0I00_3324 [Novosphingobium kunmingense]|uniref:Uncharacterized protein n=1 Tax=Novosphingobium kunmingense TaxID=1211806 RepID=A0A2N0H3K6_9SPHN|nr:hypothetical protein [Novosphingobium kunmingense]PKB13522.1 hypothetical protein B0I00_3324 [Novosphingobium kunmingense]
MHKSSPYYEFDRRSIGSLHRRHQKGEEILKEDIIALLEADPDNADDPLLQDYLLPALKGELKPNRGRKPDTMERLLRFQAAMREYDERLAAFQRDRAEGRRKREPYEREPSIQVAEEVIATFSLHCSPPSFLNRISIMRKAYD